MKKVAVITDSNSGITQSEAKKLGIHVVPMPFFVNGDTFYEDISMSQDEFYGYLAQGADVMTSQPAPDTLMKLWDSVLECYDEIVYVRKLARPPSVNPPIPFTARTPPTIAQST